MDAPAVVINVVVDLHPLGFALWKLKDGLLGSGWGA